MAGWHHNMLVDSHKSLVDSHKHLVDSESLITFKHSLQLYHCFNPLGPIADLSAQLT